MTTAPQACRIKRGNLVRTHDGVLLVVAVLGKTGVAELRDSAGGFSRFSHIDTLRPIVLVRKACAGGQGGASLRRHALTDGAGVSTLPDGNHGDNEVQA